MYVRLSAFRSSLNRNFYLPNIANPSPNIGLSMFLLFFLLEGRDVNKAYSMIDRN